MFTLTIAVNGTGNFWRRIREKFFKEQEISRQTWNSTPGTPGPFWEADTISRWIEEERRVQVPGAILSVPMLAIAKIICDRVRPLAAFGHFLER